MTSTVNALWRLVQNCTALAKSDGDLLQQFVAERAHEAFAELVRRHGPLVLGVCRRLLGDLHSAEDAFQATFLVLARKAGTLRDPDRLAPWLHGVAYRIASKARRHRLRYPESLKSEYDPIDPRAQNVDRAGDCRPLLDEAIHALPAKYREPVLLCYIEGLTNAEAAGRLGCPLGTIATRLARARDRLRLHFARRGCIVPASLIFAVLTDAAAASPLPEKLATSAIANLDGPVKACVVTLTEGAISAMKIKKLQLVLGTLLVLGLGGFGWHTFTAGAYEPPPLASEPSSPAAVHASDALIATPNFVVDGAPSRTARLIAEAAELHRKQQALYWIGKELPKWPEPCRIKVGINNGGRNGGATTFQFLKSKIDQSMQLDGTLERILSDLLPHEVTHTVLASHFRNPIPRWVDEGIASLSESPEELQNYDRKLLEAIANAKMIKMSRLIGQMDYPKDIMTFHAQSISIVRFLTKRKNPTTLLAFINDGMANDWNSAIKKHYGYEDVDEFEEDWLVSMLKQLPAPSAKAPPELPEKLANGPPPITAFAELSADGLFLRVSQPHIQIDAVTSYVQREVGGKIYYQPVTEHRQKVRSQMSVQRLDLIRAFELDGKPIDPKKLAERFKKGITVLVSHEEGKIDPFYLEIIKPGTIIIAMIPVPPTILPPAPVAPATAVPPPLGRVPPMSDRIGNDY